MPTSYVVDTNILSEGSPTRRPTGFVTAWMDARTSRLFLASVTVAEIVDGVAKASRTGATRKADLLAAWLDSIVQLYGARIFPLDVEIARVAGRLSDRARGLGISPSFADLVIGATATCRGMTVLTRNVRDFRPLGLPVLDPFAEPLPP